MSCATPAPLPIKIDDKSHKKPYIILLNVFLVVLHLDEQHSSYRECTRHGFKVIKKQIQFNCYTYCPTYQDMQHSVYGEMDEKFCSTFMYLEYLRILPYTLANFSILQHTLAYFSILQHTLAYFSILQHTLAYFSILSIIKHTNNIRIICCCHNASLVLLFIALFLVNL